MGGVNRSTSARPATVLGLDPVLAGTVCCLVSALGYTGTHLCGRQLSDLQADPMWVICIKESVTVIVVGPWLLYRAFRRRRVLPPRRVLAALVLVGLAVQLAGNVPSQWAYGVVGLAITVPAIFAVMLIASAVMGLVFLGERVSRQSAAAIGLLVASIMLLSLGAGEAGKALAKSADPWLVPLGVAAACLAGAMYATLTVVIRNAVTGRVPAATIVFITTGMGVLSLGILCIGRLGIEQLLDTPPDKFAWMLASGTLNLVAFLAIAKGLQLTTVVRANVLSASQVAMAAVAGMAFFGESRSPWLIAGIVLTVVGVVLIDRPGRDVQTLDV